MPFLEEPIVKVKYFPHRLEDGGGIGGRLLAAVMGHFRNPLQGHGGWIPVQVNVHRHAIGFFDTAIVVVANNFDRKRLAPIDIANRPGLLELRESTLANFEESAFAQHPPRASHFGIEHTILDELTGRFSAG